MSKDRPDLTDEQNTIRKEALDVFSKLKGDFDDETEEIDNPNILGILDNGSGNGNDDPPKVADKLLAIVNQKIVELFERSVQ